MKRILWMTVPVLLFAGCGARDQQQLKTSNIDRGDTPAWQGPQTVFTAKGWTPGDKASWESKMRTRSQTQNEYIRIE